MLAGTFFEDILCDRERREGVGRPDVEGQVRDDFGCLWLRQAVIHRPVEVIGNLRDLREPSGRPPPPSAGWADATSGIAASAP
jgi:hypothetical protein